MPLELGVWRVGKKLTPLSVAGLDIREKGFFGNQNSVCKTRAAIWQHTVKRLKQRFGVEEG